MKKRKTWIYNCEYCGTHKHQFPAIQRHEDHCGKNPKNKRACFGCVYLTKKDGEVYTGIYNCHSGEPTYQNRSLLYCEKKEVFLYPPGSERKGNYYVEVYVNGKEYENLPMPVECDDHNNLN